MGTRDNSSLSKNAIFISGNAGGSARRQHNDRKVGKEQTETDIGWTRGEAGEGAESGEVRRVFSVDAEGPEKRVRRGDTGGPRTARAGEAQEVRHPVRDGALVAEEQEET